MWRRKTKVETTRTREGRGSMAATRRAKEGARSCHFLFFYHRIQSDGLEPTHPEAGSNEQTERSRRSAETKTRERKERKSPSARMGRVTNKHLK
jgi:hypothetical protein